MFYSIKQFIEKKPHQKVIFVGPYTGSWGHLFHVHIPIVNYLRMEYPDAYIVSSSFIGDDFYHKDEKGQRTIDAYIGYPIYTDLRKNYGKGHFPQILKDADKICEQQFGAIDIPIIVPDRDNEYIQGIYLRYKRRCIRLGAFAPPSIDGGDFVLLHTKFHPLLSAKSAGTAQNPEFDNEMKFVEKLSNYIKVYVIGTPGWCYSYKDIPNVIDLTYLDDDTRPQIILGLANKAKAMITTTASSTLNYALAAGCPSLVFNSRHYGANYGGPTLCGRNGKWNYFGVLTHNYSPAILDADKRMELTLKFLEAEKNEPRYLHDIVLHTNNLGDQL